MYPPGKKEFARLARKGNLIPIYKEIRADLDTPVSAFLKIRSGRYNYLLESVEGSQAIARYSFLGTEPALILRSKGNLMEIIDNYKHTVKRFTLRTDPLDEIKKIMSGFRSVRQRDLPRFCGGFVGYLGYDAVRFFENIPNRNPDDLGAWDCVWFLSDTLLVFDHLHHTIKIVANAFISNPRKISKSYDLAREKIEKLHARLKRPLPVKKNRPAKQRIRIVSNFKKQTYLKLIKKAILLGNAPCLSELTEEAHKKAQENGYLTIGLNRSIYQFQTDILVWSDLKTIDDILKKQAVKSDATTVFHIKLDRDHRLPAAKDPGFQYLNQYWAKHRNFRDWDKMV